VGGVISTFATPAFNPAPTRNSGKARTSRQSMQLPSSIRDTIPPYGSAD
jgi:hypothetical protein